MGLPGHTDNSGKVDLKVLHAPQVVHHMNFSVRCILWEGWGALTAWCCCSEPCLPGQFSKNLAIGEVLGETPKHSKHLQRLPRGSTLCEVPILASCNLAFEPLGFGGGFRSLSGSLGISDTSMEISTILQRMRDACWRSEVTPSISSLGTSESRTLAREGVCNVVADDGDPRPMTSLQDTFSKVA